VLLYSAAECMMHWACSFLLQFELIETRPLTAKTLLELPEITLQALL